jgi:DNA-binding XRE family transcriptional regulator
MNDVNVNQKDYKKEMDLIKSLRALLGWSQTKMAEVLGVRQKTISDWETGKSLSREVVIGIKIGLSAANSGLSKEEIIALIPDPADSQTEEREAA